MQITLRGQTRVLGDRRAPPGLNDALIIPQHLRRKASVIYWMNCSNSRYMA